MKTITIPTSKSQTIRALLIAVAAKGKSIIKAPLDSEDIKSCVKACIEMGADVKWSEDRKTITVDPSGVTRGKYCEIDCGNSGTTLYLAMALAAGLGLHAKFIGDESLKKRPVAPLVNSLRDLGVRVLGDSLPITVSGPLVGGKTSIECRTSQYLSALLLACPLADNPSHIDVPLLYERPYVGITLSWLARQQVKIDNDNYSAFDVPVVGKYRCFEERIGGDYSSASFFFVYSAITGEEIRFDGLNKYDTQGDKGILTVLKRMGAACRTEDGGDIVVSNPDRKLRGKTFDLNGMPDSLPILAVAGCFAEGETRLINVSQAKIKESDRIAVMAEELSKLGADIKVLSDGLVIRGPVDFSGVSANVSGHKDHRVTMALEICSSAAKKLYDADIRVEGKESVNITFPTFYELLESVR